MNTASHSAILPRARLGSLRSFFTLVPIVACAIGYSLSAFAADEKSATGKGRSEESSSKSGETPDEAVPRDAEGLNGVPNAVIDDPDGYVNLRKEKSADSPIVAKVKKDEPFEFECTANDTWCKVKLASGVTGWMHYSRIKRYYTEKDLPKGPEDSGDEIDDASAQARRELLRSDSGGGAWRQESVENILYSGFGRRGRGDARYVDCGGGDPSRG